MGKKEDTTQYEVLSEYPKPTPARSEKEREYEENAHFLVILYTYFSWMVLLAACHVREFLDKHFLRREYMKNYSESNGFAPITSDFESFYTRRIYYRIRDCWNRPVTGVPGRTITILDRVSEDENYTFQLTGKKIDTVNMSSYNYLGFAQNEGPCAEAVEKTINQYGVGCASPRMDGGTLKIHQETEELVAEYVGQEAAMICSMGYATNSTTIPALIGKGGLIISDELNHSSIVTGSRNSGARIRVFKHNDMKDLEEVLIEAISQGIPKTHRPWKKILVIVEGIYSMEGNICNLPAIIALKEKYKFYLYVDEAHSIGALGKSGRGVCEYWGISPKKIDILMGTFTKSFGAAGGYIAGSKELIAHMKTHAHCSIYAESMSPAVCQQVISSLSIIMGKDGTGEGKKRILQLAQNSIYMRKKLKEQGYLVYGDNASPIIPVILFHPAKLAYYSRFMLEKGVSVVVVGYPATPITSCRVRYCLSASHTKEDIDYVLEKTSEIADTMVLRYNKGLLKTH